MVLCCLKMIIEKKNLVKFLESLSDSVVPMIEWDVKGWLPIRKLINGVSRILCKAFLVGFWK